MGAVVELDERNGIAASPTDTDDIANVNFGSIAQAELVPASYPITAQADGHSFEKWLRLNVTDMGDVSKVDNFKLWLSNLGGGWKTDEGISSNLRTVDYIEASYPTDGPIETDSSDAVIAIPEEEPLGANIGIGGALAGFINEAPGYSDWIVLQLDVSADTPAGSVNQKTLTFSWDEQ